MEHVQHTLRVSLRGKDNETYSGTLVIRNWTSLLTDTAEHGVSNAGSSNSSGGAQGRLEDPTGASYYVIAVVMVYGFSIVMLIASHIKRKHQKVQEDRQIHKYLQEFLVVQEKSSRDSYKKLKRSIIQKLYRDKSCTSRHLSKTLFPMMAIALPSQQGSETESRRHSMSRLSMSRLSMASSVHRHPHVTSLQNVAEDAKETDSSDMDQDICMEAIEPGMDPALKELSDSDSEASPEDYKEKDYLEIPAITVPKGSTHASRMLNHTPRPSPLSTSSGRSERDQNEPVGSRDNDSSDDEEEVDVPVTIAAIPKQATISPTLEEEAAPRLPPPPPPITNQPEALIEDRPTLGRGTRPRINGHLQAPQGARTRLPLYSHPHVQAPIAHQPNSQQRDRPRLKMASLDQGSSKGVGGVKVSSPVNGLMQEEDPELFNLRYGHGMGSCSPLIKDPRDLWPAPGALRYGDPGSVTPPGLRYTNAGATITPPTPQYGNSLSPPPLHISPPRGLEDSATGKHSRRAISNSPVSSPDNTPLTSPTTSPRHSPHHQRRHSARHSSSPRHSPRHSSSPRHSPRQSSLPRPSPRQSSSPSLSPRQSSPPRHSPRSQRLMEEGLVIRERPDKSDLSSPETERLLHITCV